jgi:uncharacterized membrane protein YqaE (UPF0057 family)
MGFLNIVLSPIEVIFDPIVSAGNAVVALIHILLELIKVAPKLVSLFEIFTDPGKIIKDAVYGVKVGLMMLFDAIFGNLFSALKKPFIQSKTKKNKPAKMCLTNRIIQLIILVLCPPLAIFMEKGISSFFYMVIASILTYFYYFPGLIYSSMYVL